REAGRHGGADGLAPPRRADRRRDEALGRGRQGREHPGRVMRIARVAATPLNVPVTLDVAGIEKHTSLSACLVEVETDNGLAGHGFTAITEEEVVAAAVNEVAAPNLAGEDPLAHEKVWEKLYWLMSPRGQTGYALHAIAAIDV